MESSPPRHDVVVALRAPGYAAIGQNRSTRALEQPGLTRQRSAAAGSDHLAADGRNHPALAAEVRREVLRRDLVRRPPRRVAAEHLGRRRASARSQRGVSPVSSSARRTGSYGNGATSAPAANAIAVAATTACWAARPPCLIGARRHVAHRVDVVDADDAAELVDVDEAARIAGALQAPARRGAGARSRGRRADVAPPPSSSAPSTIVARRGASTEAHAGLGEQRGDLGADRAAEHLERAGSRA